MAEVLHASLTSLVVGARTSILNPIFQVIGLVLFFEFGVLLGAIVGSLVFQRCPRGNQSGGKRRLYETS